MSIMLKLVTSVHSKCLMQSCMPALNFHTSIPRLAVEKSLLAKLRKTTGYSLSECKKALEQFDNDLEKSEEWLKKEAQQKGWAKATKLSSRATTQGLIGVFIEGNIGSLIEVNCETDFVARNEDFRGLVAKITNEFATSSSLPPQDILIKESYSKEQLSEIKTRDGKSLADLVALSIGKIGENIQLTRGLKVISPPDIDLVGYVHPTTADAVPPLLGKYGAIAAFKNAAENQDVARQICAHIVGMNPSAVGSEDDEKNPIKDEETLLIHQEFLNDNEMTVGEVLKENEFEVVDFVRLECGNYQDGAFKS